MAEQNTIARPYANAVFAVAKDSELLQEWQELLNLLAVIVQDKNMQEILTNPVFDNEQRIDLIMNTVKACHQNWQSQMKTKLTNLLRTMAEHKRLFIFPAIAEMFQQMMAQEEDFVDLTVVTVAPLSSTQKQKLEDALIKRFSRQVRMHFEEDPNLIGSMVIRSGNWVLDDSLKGKINRLNEMFGVVHYDNAA